MDMFQARADILRWLQELVEKPQAVVNGLPLCPFARQARLAGEFDIREGRIDPWTDLRHVEMGPFRVLAYVYDPAKFLADEFNQQVRDVNRGFLIPRNMISLADHPADLEQVGEVIMNQGTWALAFVQNLSELNHAARQLARQGYYDSWPESYLQNLFEHREDPRS